MAGFSFKLQLESAQQFLGTRRKGHKSEIIISGISRLVTLVPTMRHFWLRVSVRRLWRSFCQA